MEAAWVDDRETSLTVNTIEEGSIMTVAMYVNDHLLFLFFYESGEA